jgi:hypothetical protein
MFPRAGARTRSSTKRPSSIPSARAESAAARVLALCELWVIIAAHSGVVGAWRLAGVCRAARQGAKEWLRKLPGIVVCGSCGGAGGVATGEVWRLDLGALLWERLPDLTAGRFAHACCAVRGGVVVLGGFVTGGGYVPTASVEILGCASSGALGNTFNILPPLSCGSLDASVAFEIDESESDQGQVLLIGGMDSSGSSSTMRKVDLATGVCTAQPSLLCPQGHHVCGCMAGRLPDGRIVCAGTTRMFSLEGESIAWDGEYHTMAGVLEPPPHGSPSGASWQWRALPGMGVLHRYSGGCVLSDGRFAVFGGQDTSGADTSSCEVLTLDADGARWSTLSPMHEPRCGFACVAIGGCVVVAGGGGLTSAEVYEEGLGRWRRLPCRLPHGSQLCWMGSALM